MSWNSALPVTPQMRHIKHSPRSLSAIIGENPLESSSEDEVDQPSTPQNVGLPRGTNLRPRGKTMSSLEDGDGALPSFLDPMPLNLDGESGGQFSKLPFNQSQEVEIKDSESDGDTEFFVPHEDSPITALVEDNLQIAQANIKFEELEEGIEIGPEDLAARGLPSACVFVANLATTHTDAGLMRSLQAHFSRYGRLHVKIRRDSKGNPYSFCQFETDEAARRAIREGRARIIDSSGRPIRCEPAKVNRTLVLSKSDNSLFHRHEVVDMLQGFGPLESVEFSNSSSATPLFGLTSGNKCYVRFQFRQDAVDSFQSLRLNSQWISDWTSNFSAQELGMALRCDQLIEVDTVSIFVGKLNPQVTDSELRARFSVHGRIVDCNIVKKHSLGINAFAFIRYETQEMANLALVAENGSEFMGKKLHVQKREIYKRPPVIGIPAGHRSQRETGLATQTVTELGVPDATPQYLPVQQYQVQSLPVAPALHSYNNVRMDKMDSERRFPILNPVIPVVPPFHFMDYHNHYGSNVMASRYPGNLPVAPQTYALNPPTGYSFPPYTPFIPQYHIPGQGYNFSHPGFSGANEAHGGWGTIKQQKMSAGNAATISEPVSPGAKVSTLKMENLTDLSFDETSNAQSLLPNEYPPQHLEPGQSHYGYYSGPFPSPHFSSVYPLVPPTPALVDVRGNNAIPIAYDPAILQYVGPGYAPYASPFPQQQYSAARENEG